jgi:drug/metabolite transporter (DMT)-like permease
MPESLLMALLLLMLVWVIWGLSYPITAFALTGFDVMTIRCLAQLLGCSSLLFHALWRGHRLTVEREAWGDLVIAGLLNMAVLPIFFTFGVKLLGPGRTAILVYTMPIWANLFARLFLGEALTGQRITALLLGTAAVGFMVSQDLPRLKGAPLGAALTLLAALAYGLGTVWFKRRRWVAPLSVVTFWQLAIGLVPIFAIWAALSFPPELARVGAYEWGALLYLGIFSNAIAYLAWFAVVDKLSAGISALGALAIPCLAVAFSSVLARERLYPQDFAAMAMIGAALLLVLAERLRAARRLLVFFSRNKQAGL